MKLVLLQTNSELLIHLANESPTHHSRRDGLLKRRSTSPLTQGLRRLAQPLPLLPSPRQYATMRRA
jgi:hypothetical protein